MQYTVTIKCKKELGKSAKKAITVKNLNGVDVALYQLSRYLTKTTDESGYGILDDVHIVLKDTVTFYRSDDHVTVEFGRFDSGEPDQYWQEILRRAELVKQSFAEKYPDQYDRSYTVEI